MRNINLIILIACVFGIYSCENDGFYYQDEARIRMVGPSDWTLDTDSIEFSFANYSSTVTDTTFDVVLYVMGTVSDQDRTASIEIVEEETTASSSFYTVDESVVIPAGQDSIILPVKIYRDESLEEDTVTLFLEVVENDDFKVGVSEEDHLKIIWNDILSKPTNWDDLEEFFGSYSLVKYRFIIDTLNIATFDTDELTWAQLKNYQIVLVEALRVYNEENSGNPLTDEDGDLVSFD